MKIFTLIFSIWFLIPNAFGQTQPDDTTKTKHLYLIVKNDGVEYIGEILSDDGREVLILTEILGKIYIPKSEIKSITKIESKSDIIYGEYRDHGPFTTRYAFTTNALPIIKGENYALINLYGPEVHFAVSNNFNLGIMSSWIASPMILALKYSIKTKSENINLSVGSLSGTSGYLNVFRGYGGLHFANITLGNRMKNITLSGGYAYVKSGIYSDEYQQEGTFYSQFGYLNNSDRNLTPIIHGPIFSIAGIASVGSKASFIFDSMLGIFNSYKFDNVTTIITPSSYDYITSQPIPGLYEHVVTKVATQDLALFIMPGMRFQTKENRAFQIALAGVSVFRLRGNANNDDYSFPIPMCTWFFKF